VNILPRTSLDAIPFVAFDTETTGMDFSRDRLVDFGAVRFRGDRIDACFESLVNPAMPMPGDSLAIHRITDRMVARAPGAARMLPRLMPILRGAVLLAHNAPFDMAVLVRELARARMRVPDLAVLDTCILADRLDPGLPSLRLGDLMTRIGSAERNVHRALPDARCAMALFRYCLDRMGNGPHGGGHTWADLLALHGPAFSLTEFSRWPVVRMWHCAVTVNAIECRRPVRVVLARARAGVRELRLRPRGFEIRGRRWCLLPARPRPAPIYMDGIRRMSKQQSRPVAGGM
jgi:DNA polymerase III epsilon subunit-like protein